MPIDLLEITGRGMDGIRLPKKRKFAGKKWINDLAVELAESIKLLTEYVRESLTYCGLLIPTQTRSDSIGQGLIKASILTSRSWTNWLTIYTLRSRRGQSIFRAVALLASRNVGRLNVPRKERKTYPNSSKKRNCD